MTQPRRYRKRPVEITAFQWTGDNADAMREFTCGMFLPPDDANPAWLYVAANSSSLPLEVGEWVAQDRLGYYPIKDEVFAETYEPVDDQ